MIETRSSPSFRVAIGGSVFVHLIAFILLVPFASRIQQPAPDTVLEVQLVPAQPLPVAPAVVEPPHAEQHLPPPRVTRPRPKPLESPKELVERPPVLSMNTPSEPRSQSIPAPPVLPAPVAQPAETKAASNAQPAAVAAAPREAAAITPPSSTAAYLSNPRPEYPRLARRNGEEGTVILRVLVTRQGLPARVETDKSSGSTLLDDAALRAVKGWRFAPARKGLEPIEEWVRVPIVFRLENVS
jgi:protein TonB